MTTACDETRSRGVANRIHPCSWIKSIGWHDGQHAMMILHWPNCPTHRDCFRKTNKYVADGQHTMMIIGQRLLVPFVDWTVPGIHLSVATKKVVGFTYFGLRLCPYIWRIRTSFCETEIWRQGRRDQGTRAVHKDHELVASSAVYQYRIPYTQ